VRARLVGVEEDPGAVVGADEARPGREDGAVVVVGVDAAAEDASGAEEGGVVAEARGEEEPRERRGRGRRGLALDEAVDPVVPRLADEGHAGAVVLARDAAEYRNHEVVGELVVRQKVRRHGRRLGCGHGGGGGRRDRRPERMSVARRRLARPARLLPGTGRMVEEEEGVGGGAGSERPFYFGAEAGGGAS